MLQYSWISTLCLVVYLFFFFSGGGCVGRLPAARSHDLLPYFRRMFYPFVHDARRSLGDCCCAFSYFSTYNVEDKHLRSFWPGTTAAPIKSSAVNADACSGRTMCFVYSCMLIFFFFIMHYLRFIYRIATVGRVFLCKKRRCWVGVYMTVGYVFYPHGPTNPQKKKIVQ